jgi:hypothetical protein
MKIIAAAGVAAIMLAAGCSSGVATPGNDIRGALPEKTHTLEEMWDDAGNVLFSLGRPMKLDTYTEVHGISGSGILVIDVRSHDFDPVAVVLDGEDNLVAFCDDWKETSNARVVLDGVPSGGRLLVFSPDDSRGLYDVVVTQGSIEDLETFQSMTSLESGMVRGFMDEGSNNPVLESALRNALENNVYNYNYSQAQLFPFSVTGHDLVSLSLESDQFDPYLVLMSIEDRQYFFVNYNDDYNGAYSRLIQELDPGDYIAVVMPYSAGGTGDFTLKMESVDPLALEPVGVSADQPGMEYRGDIVPDRNFAIAWWPEIGESWEVPAFLDPFSPVAAFTFSVDRPAVHQLSAYGDVDICLTLLKLQDGFTQFVASNDDYIDMGTDSRILQPLMPGDYIAIVSPYSLSDGASVTFAWEVEETDLPVLRQGRSTQQYADYETESLLYRLELQSGRSYTISVESQELDPVITLYLPDGEILYDDDGGEGTNSMLTFTPSSGQTGDAFLVVEKYSAGEGTFSIELR